MKKITIMMIVILLVCIILLIHYYKYENVEQFSLKDYQEYIEKFSSEKVLGRKEELGEIKDFEEAKKVAEKIWIEVYGKEVLKKRPYKVFFDYESEVWLVEGSSSSSKYAITNGGVPYFIVEKKTGRVLAIWHDK